MRPLLLISQPLIFCAGCFGDANLLINCQFESDGIGGVLDWKLRSLADSCVERVDGTSPDGAAAHRIVFGGVDYLSQGRISLKDGETYEASAWIRTKGLPSGIRFLYYDDWWAHDSRGPEFPRDTGGKWERIVWRFSPFGGTGEYSFAIGGGATGKSGMLEIAGLALTPVSPGAAASARPATPSPKMVARIVPIDPLLADIDPDDAHMTFYYPGDLDPDPGSFEIVAKIGNADWVSAPMDASRRVRLSFGRLSRNPRGEYFLRTAIRRRVDGRIVCKNDYPVTIRPRAGSGPAGRKLNNLVTELFRSGSPGSSVRFFNPRRGWVYAGFLGQAPAAYAYLDGCTVPVIRPRPGERAETMRFIEAGWQTIVLRNAPGNVPFVVRAVPRIVHAVPSFDSKKTDLLEWRPRYDFMQRYAIPFFNVAAFYRRSRDPGRIMTENAELNERGIAIESMVGFGSSEPDRADIRRVRGIIFGGNGWAHGFPISIDENGVSSPRPWRVNIAETIWSACDAPQQVNAMYADAVHSVYTDPTTQTSEISAIVNSGRGEGMLYPEAYCTALADPVAAHQWEDQLLRYRASVTNLVPGAAKNIVYYFGTFLEPGHYTDWSRPEGDMKVLYSDFLRRIATDPAYGEPGGIGAGYFSYTDDDVARWLSRAVRYYAIEGGTNDLAAVYGFQYLSGHLQNADFDKGLEGWHAVQGGPGGVQVFKVSGYGSNRGQNRKKAPPGTGDNVVLFTRQKAPNAISQRLTGLVPGTYYHVHFVAADEEDVRRPDHSHFISAAEENAIPSGFVTNGTFMASAHVTDGGVEIPELTGLHIPWVRRRNWKEILFNQYRVVFRATSTSAVLTITDWRSDSDPGGEIGRRIYVNFVNVRKYYVEDEKELEWLKSRRRDDDFVSRE